jgi:hypothetical protein
MKKLVPVVSPTMTPYNLGACSTSLWSSATFVVGSEAAASVSSRNIRAAKLDSSAAPAAPGDSLSDRDERYFGGGGSCLVAQAPTVLYLGRVLALATNLART